MNAPVAISDQSVTVALIHPISVNNAFANVKGGGRRITERYRTWRQAAAAEARGYSTGRAVRLPTILGPFHAHLFVPEKGRAMDLDNTAKAYLDLLKELGVIEDDGPKFLRGLALDWTEEGQGRAVITPIPHRERG